MSCFHPLPGWRAKRLSETGKRPIAFRLAEGFRDMPVEIPCGKCTGCVQDRANEWALRCEHEAKCWEHNWFLTLTYEDGKLPANGSLEPRDLELFWKRLRKSYEGVRYFAVGEYGERLERPHYHALLFNCMPRDLRIRKRTMDDKVVYESQELHDLWGRGRIQLDAFSPGAAQYVTNYVRKKVKGSGASAHYGVRLPEFQVMSRRPGIGGLFVRKFMKDVYPDGYVTRKGGSKRRAPRFYDLTLEKVDARMYRKVKRRRREVAANDVDKKGSRLYTLHELAVKRNEFFDQVKGRRYERPD